MKFEESKTIIQELCDKYELPYDLMQKMLDLERASRHLKQRPGITDRLQTLIRESLNRQDNDEL